MSMLRRALVGAIAAAALLAPIPAAQAASSATCVYETSTRLLTANNGEYKVWLEKTTPLYSGDEYTLCWKVSGQAAGAFVIRSPFRGDPSPSVQYVVNDPSCPNFFTVQDPVQLVTELQTQLGNPYGFCFGVGDNRAVRVSLGVPYVGFPDVQVWLDKNTALGRTFCTTSALIAELYYECRYSYYTSVRVV